jgi:hypothetical protein
MKTLFLLVCALPIAAVTIPQPIVIDCGSAQDQYFQGGLSYTVQPAADTTLRFSAPNPAGAGSLSLPFSYRIPVDLAGPYTLELNFMEPSAAPPARAFSVTVNDQLSFPRITMDPYLSPFTRRALVYGVAGFVNIRFDTIVRSAVVSSIRLIPFVTTNYIVPSDPRQERVTDVIPVWVIGQGYNVPRPISEPDATIAIFYRNVEVYRNGIRQRRENQAAGARDYSTPQTIGQLVVMPVSGQPWPDTDTVTVDYEAIWPPAAVAVAALDLIRSKCARCHGNDLKPGDTHLVGNLDLRTLASMLEGGDRGPALAPGDPDSSLIYRFAVHPQFPTATAEQTLALTTANDDSLGMPPFGRLKDSQIQIIRDWIAAGALEPVFRVSAPR